MLLAKYVKIMHHRIRVLRDYDVTVWVDGSFRVTNTKLYKDATEAVSAQQPLAAHTHSRWHRVFEDVVYCSNFANDPAYLRKRYATQDMLSQYLHYLEQGFDDNRAFECGILVRRQRHAQVNAFMNAWWHHNLTHTYQDQISFGYLVERLHMPVNVIGDNIYHNTLVGPHGGHDIDDNNKKKIVLRQQPKSNAVVSYDCFDTLVGRLCYHPHEVFRIMEHRLGLPGFYEARRTIETYAPEMLLASFYATLKKRHPL